MAEYWRAIPREDAPESIREEIFNWDGPRVWDDDPYEDPYDEPYESSEELVADAASDLGFSEKRLLPHVRYFCIA